MRPAFRVDLDNFLKPPDSSWEFNGTVKELQDGQVVVREGRSYKLNKVYVNPYTGKEYSYHCQKIMSNDVFNVSTTFTVKEPTLVLIVKRKWKQNY